MGLGLGLALGLGAWLRLGLDPPAEHRTDARRARLEDEVAQPVVAVHDAGRLIVTWLRVGVRDRDRVGVRDRDRIRVRVGVGVGVGI